MKNIIKFFVLFIFLVLFFNVSSGLANSAYQIMKDVPVNKTWTYTFNQAIQVNTVKGNVYLSDGTKKVAVTTTVTGKKLTIKPTSNLKSNTMYTLVITKNVKDITGKSISATITQTFVTKKAVKKFAAPATNKKFQSEYPAMTWNLPKKNYAAFYLVGTNKAGEIVGGYDTRKGTSLFGIKIGASRTTVSSKYGAPIKGITKNKKNYLQSYKDANGYTTSGTYLIDQNYVTFFYDIHAKYTVRAILWVTADVEQSKQGFFRTNVSTTFRGHQEELMVHLINQARVAKGLKALTYTPKYNYVSRNHSKDMATYNYFSHTNRQGKKSIHRMKAAKMKFSYYGENIAYGQYSSIYAHEALMNSIGHRKNILRPNFTHMTSGIAFKKASKQPYYTMNFYRK